MIQKLLLNNFRNYKLQNFDFSDQINLIIGPNAAGKTSIIEAIYLLSSGNSFRAGKIAEMVKFGEEVAHLGAYVNTPVQGEMQLEITLTTGQVAGKKTQYRLFKINNTKKRKKDFIAQFLSVVFRPEDLRLIEGSKSRRRKFLDEALSILDWQYAHAFKKYDEALKKVNKLLWLIREGEQPVTALTYFNQTLIKHGTYLQNQRQKFLESFKNINFALDFNISYQPSVISEIRIKQYQKRAIVAGHSLIGPHKDDFIVFLDNHDIAKYGSRGQQRMAVLWLKLCQLNFLESKSKQKAVLLLDDILSELDQEMRQHVFDLLDSRQSIITSADERVIAELKTKSKKIKIIKLN